MARAITTQQHDHYPSHSQFLYSTSDLTPPSGLTGTVKTAFGPSDTGVRTQDGHTAYTSLIPQRTPRTSSAAIHRFSHTTVTVMQSSRYPYTADLLSLDECRPIVLLLGGSRRGHQKGWPLQHKKFGGLFPPKGLI